MMVIAERLSLWISITPDCRVITTNVPTRVDRKVSVVDAASD